MRFRIFGLLAALAVGMIAAAAADVTAANAQACRKNYYGVRFEQGWKD